MAHKDVALGTKDVGQILQRRPIGHQFNIRQGAVRGVNNLREHFKYSFLLDCDFEGHEFVQVQSWSATKDPQLPLIDVPPLFGSR
jgi:hypothetical protein